MCTTSQPDNLRGFLLEVQVTKYQFACFNPTKYFEGVTPKLPIQERIHGRASGGFPPFS